MRHFIVPLALASGLLTLAPFWGAAQLLFRQRFSDGTFVVVMLVVFLILALAIMGWVIHRVTKSPPAERLMRVIYLLVGTLLLLSHGFETGRPLATLAVERLHLAVYALIGLLFYRGFRQRRADGGMHELLSALAASALVGVLDEGVQALTATRVGEIYDIRINLAASLAGVMLGFAVYGWSRSRPSVAGRRETAVLATLLVLAIGAFVHRAHLGYEIVHPELGTMRSFYDAPTLTRLNAVRRESWRTRVPRSPRPLELEDRFRTEAGYHVTKRNGSRHQEAWTTAWHEHRLTEHYYSAFLDSAGRTKTDHRLVDVQVQEILNGLPADYDSSAAAYRSGVLTEPEVIWIWPKSRWWLAVVLLMVAILSWGLRPHRTLDPLPGRPC